VKTGSRVKRVLVLSAGSFPSRVQPVHGVFVKERLRFVQRLPGIELRVLSPIPLFPPLRMFKRWYPWSQVPRHEVVDGIEVFRPRYLAIPKIGACVQPRLIELAARREIRRWRGTFRCDVIDSHFIFPNGVAAVRLGKRLGVPVVSTGRGADIVCCPDYPIIGAQVRFALRCATQLIAVSREIADRMVALGADESRVTVIPNGVDCERFGIVERRESRRRLGLDSKRPIILAVGYRLELKGFHILIDAIPAIRRWFPDVLVAIVGGQARWAEDFRPALDERIRVNDVMNHVFLAGTRPQEELPFWYSAANVLGILSSREGSPNVLMEALACGLPAVATRVGGIPDVLDGNPQLGILLEERSAPAAASGLISGLSCPWDPVAIRHYAENRNWMRTAEKVGAVIDLAISGQTPSEFGVGRGAAAE